MRIILNKIKKGFTLVELLAVIVVLAIILVIAIPSILDLIFKARTGVYKRDEDILVDISRRFISGASRQLPANIGDKLIIPLSELQNNSTIDQIIDPQDSKIACDGYVEITKASSNKYDYKACLTCGNNYTTPSCTAINNVDVVLPSGSNYTTPSYFSNVEVVLPSGMIPAYYDETAHAWKKADITNAGNIWYDYTNQKWANAVTVTSINRATYQSAAVGTTISMNDINAMFVYIPRFKYSIPSGTGPRQINVVFETKDTLKSTGSAIAIGNSYNYYTHPAFTFGDKELSGIWVGKFETGYLGALTANGARQDVNTSNKIIIKPDSYSWRKIKVSNAFTVSNNMTEASNVYGLTTTDGDSHMIKNTEWGAVAYLSHSKYGKYGNASYTGTSKEIYINNSSDFLTGRSYGAQGIVGTPIIQYSNYTYNGLVVDPTTGAISGDYSKKTEAYGASTTGTIYGIYDMSGGSYEYTMGVYKLGTDLSGFVTWPNEKYYDNYLGTTVANNYIKGDATFETAGWYSDSQTFIESGWPWMDRGGGTDPARTIDTGPFHFDNATGEALGMESFRVVIAP